MTWNLSINSFNEKLIDSFSVNSSILVGGITNFKTSISNMENFENTTSNSTDEFSVKDSLTTLILNFDKAFLVMMGILIIFMQAGFGFLEAGSIRAKNATNILIKNYADLCMGGISFWLTGFSFAFGEHNPFIGLDHFLLINTPRSDYPFFFFQVSLYSVQQGASQFR